MSAAPAPAAAVEAPPPEPKGGGLARVLPVLTLVVGVVAGGTGTGLGLAAAGLIGGGGGHAPAADAHPAEPVQYVEIDNAFTSNLTDTGRYLQLRLSVSTTGGEAVAAAIAKHKPALVSAVLAVLGDMAEADVADRAAKDRMRARLKAAINDALKAKGESGGIDEVFLTSLVVQ